MQLLVTAKPLVRYHSAAASCDSKRFTIFRSAHFGIGQDRKVVKLDPVVLSARDQATLSEAAAAMPGEALALPADVTDPETPAQLVEAAVERFGGLHVLVANAGITDDTLLLRMSEEQFERVIDTNLTGTFLASQAAALIQVGAGSHDEPERWPGLAHLLAVAGLHIGIVMGFAMGAARFAFAHGGKDGFPYPVDTETYDRTVEVLRAAVTRAA